MGHKFNGGNGAFICDNCRTTMLDYFPIGFLEEFYEVTQVSGKFKNITVCAKEGHKERFCSITCTKEYFNEDCSLSRTVYDD